ncbi:hypothetical protein [Alicyclobacillus mali (ex Roth et al. 2021)]|uniref:hypothetical protein n=1 Tax=Alicyclobacillus mali (ex Roth et al. 2021) TaxID=1123961 RepID=UPI001A8C179C|nr:hypothetical protein [Alicyclobacillus mali (ex Roth et al. 2021)]
MTPAIRHLLATIGYRASRVLNGVPDTFATFSAGEGVRTPVELVHHVGDVLLIVYRDLRGGEREELPAGPWREEVERLFRILEDVDQAIAQGAEPTKRSWEQLLQGPIADALTHIGQLATLRRLAGNPMPAESYLRAEVQVGHFRY